MTKIVLLDAGPLSAVIHPRANRNQDIKEWLQDLLRAGCEVVVPEIADYEVRRELLRANKTTSVERLDALRVVGYMSLSTEVMLRAAELWARARQAGQATADDKALDADVILAAQAISVGGNSGEDVMIATTNVGHLSRFTRAEVWSNISPHDC